MSGRLKVTFRAGGGVKFDPDPSTWILKDVSIRQVFAELDASYKERVKGKEETPALRRFIASAISLKFDELATRGIVRIEEAEPEKEEDDAEEDDEEGGPPPVH